MNNLENNIPAIIEHNKPIFISAYCKSLTLNSAQNSKQLSSIVKENSKEFLEKIIIKIIAESLKIIPNDFKAEQIIYLAKYISNELWYWKIDDLVLCIKNGFTLKYGKIYGQVSMLTFMEWFNEYDKEKNEYYEEKIITEHNKYGIRDSNTEPCTTLVHNNILKKIE